jgi:hypothetical protein
LDTVARFWDIGSGLGIPGIPVAILKPQLEVNLVESNRKKSIFLEEAIEILKLKQVTVMNVRFETLGGFDGQDCVAMRAVEKMERIAAKVVAMADEASQMLIFGGSELRIQPGPRHRLQRHLIPPSDERFVYELSCGIESLCVPRGTSPGVHQKIFEEKTVGAGSSLPASRSRMKKGRAGTSPAPTVFHPRYTKKSPTQLFHVKHRGNLPPP